MKPNQGKQYAQQAVPDCFSAALQISRCWALCSQGSLVINKQQIFFILKNEAPYFLFCLIIGIVKYIEYNLWVGFKAWLFTFLFMQIFVIAQNWRVIKSLVKGDRL